MSDTTSDTRALQEQIREQQLTIAGLRSELGRANDRANTANKQLDAIALAGGTSALPALLRRSAVLDTVRIHLETAVERGQATVSVAALADILPAA